MFVFCDESLHRAVVCGVDKCLSVGRQIYIKWRAVRELLRSMQLDGGKSICYVFYDCLILLMIYLVKCGGVMNKYNNS